MIAPFLGGLESVFSWLVEASWQASVLAVLVLGVQAALRGGSIHAGITPSGCW